MNIRDEIDKLYEYGTAMVSDKDKQRFWKSLEDIKHLVDADGDVLLCDECSAEMYNNHEYC